MLPEFVVGPIGVAYDGDDDRIVIVLEELVLTDEEGNPDPAAEAINEHGAGPPDARPGGGFCTHAEGVVGAGRPSCRWCGRPIDPDGHLCARMN